MKKIDIVKDAVAAVKTVNPALELEKVLIRIKTDLQDCQHYIDNHEVCDDKKIFGHTVYTDLGVAIVYLNITITEFHKRIQEEE